MDYDSPIEIEEDEDDFQMPSLTKVTGNYRRKQTIETHSEYRLDSGINETPRSVYERGESMCTLPEYGVDSAVEAGIAAQHTCMREQLTGVLPEGVDSGIDAENTPRPVYMQNKMMGTLPEYEVNSSVEAGTTPKPVSMRERVTKIHPKYSDDSGIETDDTLMSTYKIRKQITELKPEYTVDTGIKTNGTQEVRRNTKATVNSALYKQQKIKRTSDKDFEDFCFGWKASDSRDLCGSPDHLACTPNNTEGPNVPECGKDEAVQEIVIEDDEEDWELEDQHRNINRVLKLGHISSMPQNLAVDNTHVHHKEPLTHVKNIEQNFSSKTVKLWNKTFMSQPASNTHLSHPPVSVNNTEHMLNESDLDGMRYSFSSKTTQPGNMSAVLPRQPEHSTFGIPKQHPLPVKSTEQKWNGSEWVGGRTSFNSAHAPMGMMPEVTEQISIANNQRMLENTRVAKGLGPVKSQTLTGISGYRKAIRSLAAASLSASQSKLDSWLKLGERNTSSSHMEMEPQHSNKIIEQRNRNTSYNHMEMEAQHTNRSLQSNRNNCSAANTALQNRNTSSIHMDVKAQYTHKAPQNNPSATNRALQNKTTSNNNMEVGVQHTNGALQNNRNTNRTHMEVESHYTNGALQKNINTSPTHMEVVGQHTNRELHIQTTTSTCVEVQHINRALQNNRHTSSVTNRACENISSTNMEMEAVHTNRALQRNDPWKESFNSLNTSAVEERYLPYLPVHTTLWMNYSETYFNDLCSVPIYSFLHSLAILLL